MIKWFCDRCHLEILAPEHPVWIKCYRAGKNRDDEDIGWGPSDYFVEKLCHKRCADELQAIIENAVK